MKAAGVLVLTVAMLFALAPPDAAAQAPAPKVTITGLIDNVVNFNSNQGLNAADRLGGGLAQRRDEETYARTRGRFDIIGEVGKAKGVLGLEVDTIYGQTGATDTCSSSFGATQVGCRPDGTSGGFDADNDVRGLFEVKWLYVEFPFSGSGSLLPFIPVAGTARVGGQPYTQNISGKPSILADSDFGGLNIDLAITPTLKLQATYAQFEEKLVGNQGNLAATGFGRGDDWGIILGVETSPIKGLIVKPIYAYQEFAGTTSALLRRGTGGYAVGGANFNPDSTTAGSTSCVAATVVVPCRATEERRHTVGVDSTWRSGPAYFNPTFFYQFGQRERIPSATDPGVSSSAGAQRIQVADISAWIVDVQGGYQLGPLLLEARGMYTSGNDSEDNLNKSINYYQPFQTGNSYWSGWGEANTIGSIDYLTSLYGFSNSLSQAGNIGYDRYGRAQFALRARYSLTPALSVYGIVSPAWTAKKVDTDQVITANGLAVPTGATTTVPGSRADKGDDRYLGTGLTAGFTWQFAPGLTFDAVYGVFLPGAASDVTVNRCTFAGGSTTGCGASTDFVRKDAENTHVASARVRFAF
jgi:hypothetical protein